MKRIALGALLCAAIMPPAAAQVLKGPVSMPSKPTSGGPIAGRPTGKSSKSIASNAGKKADVTLSITYPATQMGGMWANSPSGNFQCAQPVIGMINTYRCSLTVPAGTALAVKAIWSPNMAIAGSGIQVGGSQWGGACAGTVGDTCTVTMTDNLAASVDPSKLGGVKNVIGETTEP